MYQRSYYPGEEQNISVPHEYDGTLNFESPSEPKDTIECHKSCEKAVGSSGILSLLGDMPKRLFGGFELGVEELLLIGAALFLFISKSGDFECIFILIALLFVR